MTIKGFVEFIKSQNNLIQSIELRKTKVLIDGHQMQRQLNIESSRAEEDYRFGSDYTNYAETIRRFLRRLKICEIIPIIVFDGSIDPERYETAFRGRIQEIRRIERNGYECGFQSPSLCNYVFSAVVREFGIDVIQTCSQTWPVVAQLANKLECPVFSHRQDFFAMDIEFGVIISDLLSQRNPLQFSQRHRNWFIPCKVFRTAYLFECYKGFKPEVLPLLAVVLKNKLLDRNGYQAISDEIIGWHQKNNIDILLHWLRGKSFDKALEAITKYLKPKAFDENWRQSDENLRAMVDKYVSVGSDPILTRYLTESDFECESLKMLAKGDVEVVLPNWFITEYQKGIIRPALMNIVKMKTHVLYPQMENFSLPSSFDCTLTLRRFLYGILRTEIQSKNEIKILDRKGLDMNEDLVAPLLHISEVQELPFLGAVRKMDANQRRALFLSVLEVSESYINRCKVALVLYDFCEESNCIDSIAFLVIIMRYWIKTNARSDWKPFIGALVLSIIYYSRRDLKTDDKWTHLCNTPVGDQFEPTYVHHFCQLQACLHMANFINIIFGFAFKEGKPYYCLNGIFLYNATKRLSIAEEYEPFLNYLFRNWSSMASVYNDMIQLIVSDLNVKPMI